MKKLIIILLALCSCSENDAQYEIVSKEKGSNGRVQVCPDPSQSELKGFAFNGSYGPPTLTLGEAVTIMPRSEPLNSYTLGAYTVTVEIKNVGSKRVVYYKDGVYIGLLNSGASKYYTWSGAACNLCIGPPCPLQFNASFNFTVVSAGGSQSTCSAPIQVKLYTAPGNSPEEYAAQIITYTFVCP